MRGIFRTDFWKIHRDREHIRLAVSRRDWWTPLIDGTRARDLRNEAALLALGWHVVTIWECALRKKSDHPWLLSRMPSLLGPAGAES